MANRLTDYRPVIHEGTPEEQYERRRLRGATPRGRACFSLVTAATSAILGGLGMAVAGVAAAFAGFGGGGGWLPVLALAGFVWIGGLSAVLSLLRDRVLREALSVQTAVVVAVVTSIVSVALGVVGLRSYGAGLLIGGIGTLGLTYALAADR